MPRGGLLKGPVGHQELGMPGFEKVEQINELVARRQAVPFAIQHQRKEQQRAEQQPAVVGQRDEFVTARNIDRKSPRYFYQSYRPFLRFQYATPERWMQILMPWRFR